MDSETAFKTANGTVPVVNMRNSSSNQIAIIVNYNTSQNATYNDKSFAAKGTFSLRRSEILAKNSPEGCFPPICTFLSVN